MNPFALSGLLIGISSLFFGIFVYWKNRKSQANRIFALFVFSVAIWGFGGLKIGLIKSQAQALFWWKITYIGIIFIPVLLYHLIHILLGIKKKILLYLFYLFGFFFLILEWTPWAYLFFGLDNMGFLFNSFYWVYPPTFLFSFFVFSWFAIIFYSHYESYKALKKSPDLIVQNQIRYLFLATIVGFSGGGTCFLPCFGINLYPIFNFTVPLYPAILAYAIIRYRFMDIRWALGRTGIYLLSFLAIFLYVFVLFFLNQKLGMLVPFLVLGLFTSLTSVLLFLYFSRFFEKIAGRYFYYTYYNLQQTLQRLGRQLNQTIELDKLTNLINRSLLDALQLDKAGIILKEPKEKIFKVQSTIKLEAKQISTLLTKENSFLIKYLEQNQKPIVREEIPFIAEQMEKTIAIAPPVAKEPIAKRVERLRLLKQDMDRLEIGLFLPLFIKKELIGIIILGNKLSGEAYTVQDIDLLTTLSAQAAIAFNNALSYREIEKRKADLEHFYKLTVGRELKMIELKKKIKELEEEKEKWEKKEK